MMGPQERCRESTCINCSVKTTIPIQPYHIYKKSIQEIKMEMQRL